MYELYRQWHVLDAEWLLCLFAFVYLYVNRCKPS
jgi:heme/copper-type cytochrome/quinol oxidase subunit 3